MAELHVAEGERQVTEQEQSLSQLRARGGDTRPAEARLDEFQNSLQMHGDNRDRIAEALEHAEKERDRDPVGTNGLIPLAR